MIWDRFLAILFIFCDPSITNTFFYSRGTWVLTGAVADILNPIETVIKSIIDD